MKQRIILIASVLCGLLAAFLTRQYLNAKDRDVEMQRQQLANQYKTISVIVLKHALPAGAVLVTDDLGTVKAVESAVRGHAVDERDYHMLLGRKLVRSLAEKTPIYWSDIEGGDPLNHGLSDEISERMRAISVNVSGTAAVSGMVRPGDHVDVIGTFTLPSPTHPNELEIITQTIMQNVLVLATGRDTNKSQLFGAERERGGSGGYNSATLLVSPREAEMLVFAEQTRGHLVFTLRNPNDTYREMELPRVDFTQIQSEIDKLNQIRQGMMRAPLP